MGSETAAETPAPSGADLVDPSIRRRLGASAALGVTLVLAGAIGATTAGGLWVSANGLRAQAEQAGRQAAVTAATRFGNLAEPSAANIARALDIVLDEQLRAQAAATAMLVEAAESAGRGSDYIEDALRQIAWRSPIRRIDVTAARGGNYSTAENGLGLDELEPAFARLAASGGPGQTAGTTAKQTATGLTKAAAARPAHRAAAVRLEQELDGLTAAQSYAEAGDRQARELAHRQAEAIARLITHAVELAEDAGWGRERIQVRLETLTRQTAIERIAAGAGETIVYRTGSRRSGEENDDVDDGPTTDGRYDRLQRWIARASATRGNGRLNATVEIATRAGRGSLVESAWQNEANRLAEVDGITGVWVAEVAAAGVRLAAAAPGPAQATGSVANAWTRWNPQLGRLAAEAKRSGEPVGETAIRILGRRAATIRTAAKAGSESDAAPVAVVIEQRADSVVRQIRSETARGLAAAATLIALLAIGTTVVTRRWVTAPIEAVAGAAHCLQNGEAPPERLMESLRQRRDEIGSLGRSFDRMMGQVLARHDELTALVADKTRWLQEANRKLTETHQRIDAEIGLAKTVQHALVPQGTQTAGNLTLCSRMTPAKELGGDFVNIDAREDGRLFLAVCDVSGKGVAAALFMAVAQSAIAAAAVRHDDVREIANEANGTLNATNPLGMFVTGVIAMIDTDKGRIEFVDAGHEPPLAVAPGRDLHRLEKSGNIPLGLDPGEQYDLLTHEMAPGETIAAYTDGITDACNTEEELYGEPRLQELLQTNAGEAPEKVIQELWTAIELFSGRMAAADDKTCTVIRRHA